MKKIKYRAGYKYQLAEDYWVKTNITPEQSIFTEFFVLSNTGLLFIFSGYAWDGTSGPVRDTKRNLRASLPHDAFYQAFRMKKLEREKWRKEVDDLFMDMCVQDGVWKWMAKGYYKTLRVVGGYAADPKNKKKIFTAPK